MLRPCTRSFNRRLRANSLLLEFPGNGHFRAYDYIGTGIPGHETSDVYAVSVCYTCTCESSLRRPANMVFACPII